jgi:tetratricopeptide (TPR) repeat protein
VAALRPAAQTPARERVLGFLLACQGWFRCRLTDFVVAEKLIGEGLDLLSGPDVERERAFAHFALGFLYTWMARFKDAWIQLTTSLSQSQQAGDAWSAAWAEEVLAEIAFESGQTGLNEAPFLNTLANFEKVGELRGSSRALNYLSNITLNQGKFNIARAYMERMLGIMERIGDVWGAAGSYTKMGELAMASGDCGQAWQLFRRSLVMFQRTGDQRRTAITMRQLGEAAYAFGREDEAREHFRQALELASRLQSEAVAQDILTGVADVMLQGEQKERAVELLLLILSQPVTDQMTSLRATQLMEKARELVPEAQIQRAQAAVGQRGLWETIENILSAGF